MNIIQLREQHKINNGRPPNKYEEAIYEAILKDEIISDYKEHISMVCDDVVEDIYNLIIQQ